MGHNILGDERQCKVWISLHMFYTLLVLVLLSIKDAACQCHVWLIITVVNTWCEGSPTSTKVVKGAIAGRAGGKDLAGDIMVQYSWVTLHSHQQTSRPCITTDHAQSWWYTFFECVSTYSWVRVCVSVCVCVCAVCCCCCCCCCVCVCVCLQVCALICFSLMCSVYNLS